MTSSAIVVFTSVKYNPKNQNKNEIRIEVFRVYDLTETEGELYNMSKETATIVADNLIGPDSYNNITVLFVAPQKGRSDNRAKKNLVAFNLNDLLNQRSEKRSSS